MRLGVLSVICSKKILRFVVLTPCLFFFNTTPFNSTVSNYVSASESNKITSTATQLETLNKYLAEIPDNQNVKHPTVGVELEGVFPGTNQNDCFNKILVVFNEKVSPQLYPGYKMGIELYDFKTRHDEPRHGIKIIFKKRNKIVVWTIKEDGSIKPDVGYYGVELVSPIMKTPHDIAKYFGIVEFIKEAGFKAEPNSAAFQVHVGFTNNGLVDKNKPIARATAAETFLLTWVFSKIEVELMRVFDVNPNRQKFALPTPEKTVDSLASGEALIEIDNLYQFIENNYFYRYWALNLRALFQFGTVEIRFANSTTDIEKMNVLIDFSRKLVTAVRTKDENLLSLLQKHLNDDIPLIDLARALNMKLAKHLNKKSSICISLLKKAQG